jgi:glycosyltransferase involved in cell wall biosynthesis
VEQLGLTRAVRFLGARDDVADLIVAADVVAVPSRVEGMPGAVLEAMALERPIVASDIPMIREAVGDCAAALTPVDNPRLLARAIEGAFAADTSTTTAAARARFDAKFTPERVADRLLAFYEESIALSRWSRSRSV